MDSAMIDEYLENIDRRLIKLEQILPALATKDDLKAFATKEDLREEYERSRLDMRLLFEYQDSKLEALIDAIKLMKHLDL